MPYTLPDPLPLGYPTYNECPILADAIERLYVNISCLRDQSHLADGDAKLLSQHNSELICQIITEYVNVSHGFGNFFLDDLECRDSPPDDFQIMEDSAPSYVPEQWELSLVQWIQRHHRRASQLAKLLSSADIFKTLEPYVGQTSLPYLEYSVLKRYDFQSLDLKKALQKPDLQVIYFLTSIDRMRGVSEIIFPVIRAVRRMKRMSASKLASPTLRPLRHGISYLLEVCETHRKESTGFDEGFRGPELLGELDLFCYWLPEEIQEKMFELTKSYENALEKTFNQIFAILYHNKLLTPRPLGTLIYPNLQWLTDYIDSTITRLESPSADLSLWSPSSYLEEKTWHLEDAVKMLGEMEERQMAIDRLIRELREEPTRDIDTAIAALPTKAIDTSMFDRDGMLRCSQCWADVSVGEVVTVFANCDHWLHEGCLRTWAAGKVQDQNSRQDGFFVSDATNLFELLQPNVMSLCELAVKCPWCLKNVFTG